VKGSFKKFAVEAEIDEANLAASRATVKIDTASVDTGEDGRDQHLRSGDFFDAEKHPQITFETKRIEPLGDEEYRIVGDLTIRDVTKEVAFKGEISGPLTDPWGGTRVGIAAEAKVDRRDWGLEWNSALDRGGVLVGNTVKLAFDAELVKAA
jgi:polyisoprenoid-binding protein YceI